MKATKEKVRITDQICKQAQLMRKGGANQIQVAELLGINGSTVSRIEAAGFDKKQYDENRRIRREQEKKARETEEAQAEEQVPGQIEMEFPPVEQVMSDQTKLMRFQAAQADKICMKLEKINDTLNMILRAVRKE